MPNWGTIPDWLTFGATALTAWAAWAALGSWREQLSGRAEHDVRLEVVTAARALRYAFYDARSPLITAAEFPDSYRSRRHGEQPSAEERVEEYAHAYRGRWNALWPYIAQCAELRPRAGAVFGDACADALEALAKKAREWHFIAQEHVEQIRVGPNIVAQWTDQDWVTYVNASIAVSPERDDKLSREFEAAMAHVFESVGVRYTTELTQPWWVRLR